MMPVPLPPSTSMLWDMLLKERTDEGLLSVLPTSASLLADLRRPPSKTVRIPVRRAPQTDDMRQMLDDLGVAAGRVCPSRRRRNVLTFTTTNYMIGLGYTIGWDLGGGAA